MEEKKGFEVTELDDGELEDVAGGLVKEQPGNSGCDCNCPCLDDEEDS